jgi:hypothetical protein
LTVFDFGAILYLSKTPIRFLGLANISHEKAGYVEPLQRLCRACGFRCAFFGRLQGLSQQEI